MADIDSKETCETCRFFDVNGNVVGSCHRYPDSVVKSKAHWCGEHQLKKITLTSDTVISAWTAAQETITIGEPVTKEFTVEELAELKPKKRGRKAKSNEA